MGELAYVAYRYIRIVVTPLPSHGKPPRLSTVCTLEHMSEPSEMIDSHAQQQRIEDVAISEVLKQIAVCQPYFAFDQLKQSEDGTMWAPVKPEQPMGAERGVMAAAEIGRHLAILGSCAAARANPRSGQHYYLACKADLRQSEDALALSGDEARIAADDLVASAKADFADKRNARAETTLFNRGTGQRLYEISVDYKVLTPQLFERMYADRRVSTPAVPFNPYAEEMLGLGDVMVLDDLLSANLQELDPKTCAGHFPNFPALPVAILAHILASAAGRLFASMVDRERAPYKVVRALVQADHLAFTNDKLHLVVQHRDADDDGENRVFRCRAVSEGKTREPFGDLQITLRGAE